MAWLYGNCVGLVSAAHEDFGISALEAAALVSDADAPDPGDLAVVRDVGPDAVVFHVGTNGAIRATLSP